MKNEEWPSTGSGTANEEYNSISIVEEVEVVEGVEEV